MNIIQRYEADCIRSSKARIPDFGPGDTVRVLVRVSEGERVRHQSYEGVVIGRRRRGFGSSVRVRKMSFGEGVERVFPLYSPNIHIELVRRGVVRRAKLYYLRERTGKSARIKERHVAKVGNMGAAAAT